MPPWLLVACASLTTWRLAWLLTASDFPPVDRARRWTVKHGPGWLGELVTCHFCCSGWLALLVVALADLFASVPLPGLVWGAAWAAGPFLVELERRVSG